MFENLNPADAKTLFGSCILRHKGSLVYSGEILARENAGKFIYASNIFDLSLKKGLGVVPLKEFDTTPPVLGYFNHGKSAFFARRRPMRQYSMGLSPSCVEVKMPDRWDDGPARDASKLRANSLDACDKNIYPGLVEALTSLDKKEAYSIGVTREFAIDENLKVYYRSVFVGILNKDNGVVHFLGDKAYLKYVWKLHA